MPMRFWSHGTELAEFTEASVTLWPRCGKARSRRCSPLPAGPSIPDTAWVQPWLPCWPVSTNRPHFTPLDHRWQEKDTSHGAGFTAEDASSGHVDRLNRPNHPMSLLWVSL